MTTGHQFVNMEQENLWEILASKLVAFFQFLLSKYWIIYLTFFQ